jgi:hypothetical protein
MVWSERTLSPEKIDNEWQVDHEESFFHEWLLV